MVLVKGSLCFLFVFQNVVEASRQLGSSFPIEYYLASTYVGMTHTLLMHDVQRFQDLVCDVAQDGFGHGAYACYQVG